MGSARSTVVIVDDHEVVRDGIRRSLEGGGCEVVGEAGSVADAHDVIRATTPDVVIADIVLPDGDGVQLCREITSRHPAIACILLTSFPETRAKLSAVLAGADAYLRKDETTDLDATVHAVARGERLLDDTEILALIDDLVERATGHPRLARLTDQERRVFELIGQGLSNREIADCLHISERTVKGYVSGLLSTLDMSSRTEAAVLAARLSEQRAHRRDSAPR